MEKKARTARSRPAELKRRASLAMRTGELRDAIAAYRELETLEPDDASWPQRRADAHKGLGQREGELEARVRAADLFVDQGRVIEAIAACKLILALDPAHRAIEDRLQSLYTEAGTSLPDSDTAPRLDAFEGADFDDRTPFEELMLTQVVPGAQSTSASGDAADTVSEIPLGDDPNERSGIALDLDLEELDLEELELGAEDVVEMPRAAPDAPAGPFEQLARTPLFGSLDAATIKKLVEVVELVELREGEVLFREGDEPADALYVIAEGAVIPIAESEPPRKLGVLEAGEFFGEIGLVTRGPRQATVQAMVDTRLLSLDRRVVWRLLRARPEVFQVMLRFLRERLIDRMARTSPFFAAIARAERGAVAQQFDFLEAADASVLIQQDRPTDNLYIVLAGQLQAVDIGFEGDKVLGSVEPGELCGELSMLTGEPARAAVVANGKCWLLALPRRRFDRILARNPRLEQVIAAMARRRQRRQRQRGEQGSDRI